MAQEVSQNRIYDRTKKNQDYTSSRTSVVSKRKCQIISDNSFKNKYQSLRHEEDAKKAGNKNIIDGANTHHLLNKYQFFISHNNPFIFFPLVTSIFLSDCPDVIVPVFSVSVLIEYCPSANSMICVCKSIHCHF